MVAPLIARVAAQAAKGAAKKQVAKGAAKANAAKNVAKKAARVKNNPADVAARSKYRKRIKRRISKLESELGEGITGAVRKRAEYEIEYLQKRLAGSYANKLGQYADTLDTLRQVSENVMQGDPLTRNERLTRNILNSPVGSRIYGGLESVWNVAGVDTSSGAAIEKAIMDKFGVTSMSEVVDILQGKVPDLFEPGENEQMKYDEVKEQIAYYVRNELGIA